MDMKRLYFILISTLLWAAPTHHPSIHQVEWEKHLAVYGPLHSTADKPIRVTPLQSSAKANGLSAAVFGFLPDWEYPAAMDNLRFDLLTHIACFDFTVSADGAISNPAGWPWTDLINTAHQNGVKVILTAVNFDADAIHAILTNNSVRQTFINNVKSKMQAYGLDGVNIDFEGMYGSDEGAVINAFMAELTDSIHSAFPGSEVSIDGPAVNWNNDWDFNGLSASCDYIFIMGYAFSGSFSATSGSTAPLTGGSINITNTVETQYQDADPQKLILGVPYYGQKFQTAGKEAHATVEESLGSVTYRSAISGYKSYGTLWDTETQSPWYRYQSSSKWYQVWVDNDSSISAKFSLADRNQYKGVGMWALNYDGSSVDFWNVIQRHYLDGAQPLPSEPYAAYVIPVPDSAAAYVYADAQLYTDGYRLAWGTNPANLTDTLTSSFLPITLSNLHPDSIYYMKLQAYNSSGDGSWSSMLAVSLPADKPVALIVDGFDRQSNTTNPRNYISRHAPALFSAGYAVISATNEAIESDRLDMQPYAFTDWFLGDESTSDITFSSLEQAAVKSFLKNGGRLFVSGAEIGWDLVARGSDDDKSFYQNYLKAEYIDDAPLGRSGEYYSMSGISATPFDTLGTLSFDDGSHGSFDVDWPDAIRAVSGAHNGLAYPNVSVSSQGGAGVYYVGTFGGGTAEGKLVHMSVPFETVYPQSARNRLMQTVARFMETATAIQKEDRPKTVSKDRIFSYPNPFNSRTRLSLYLSNTNGKPSPVLVQIFDVLGREVWRHNLPPDAAAGGRFDFEWDGTTLNGKEAGSGMYIMRVRYNGRFLVHKINMIR